MSASEDSAPSGSRVDAARLEWPADPRVLAEIRRAVHRWLGGLDIAPDLRDDLVYATSEAASNSVEHAYRIPGAGGTVTVTMWSAAGILNIEIADHGHWMQPTSGPTSRGHGLQLIRGLVDTVTIESRAGGTTVSLRHPVPSAHSLQPAPAHGGW